MSDDTVPTPLRDRVALSLGGIVTGALATLGILGLLRNGLGEVTEPGRDAVFWFTASPLTHVLHLAAGLVGIPMVRTATGARRFLWAAGVLLVPFGLLGFALEGSDGDVFGRDVELSAAHLIAGIACLAAVLWRRWPDGTTDHPVQTP